MFWKSCSWGSAQPAALLAPEPWYSVLKSYGGLVKNQHRFPLCQLFWRISLVNSCGAAAGEAVLRGERSGPGLLCCSGGGVSREPCVALPALIPGCSFSFGVSAAAPPCSFPRCQFGWKWCLGKGVQLSTGSRERDSGCWVIAVLLLSSLPPVDGFSEGKDLVGSPQRRASS